METKHLRGPCFLDAPSCRTSPNVFHKRKNGTVNGDLQMVDISPPIPFCRRGPIQPRRVQVPAVGLEAPGRGLGRPAHACELQRHVVHRLKVPQGGRGGKSKIWPPFFGTIMRRLVKVKPKHQKRLQFTQIPRNTEKCTPAGPFPMCTFTFAGSPRSAVSLSLSLSLSLRDSRHSKHKKR